MVIDVDANASDVLGALRPHLERLGGHDLLACAFLTEGSAADRGKVVFTFAEPAPAQSVRLLLRTLRAHIIASEIGGRLDRKDLSTYPQQRSGGVVRVLGRNIARNGPLERAFTLDGECCDFSLLIPLSRETLEATVRRRMGGVAPWAWKKIHAPWTRDEGWNAHSARMVSLAREALSVHRGDIVRARRQFDDWLEIVRGNSPELDLPTRTNRDTRNVLDHCRSYAFKHAVAEPVTWQPTSTSGAPRGASRLYTALVGHVRANGLVPLCFGIDFETLAAQLETVKVTAWRWAAQAEQAGLVVRHHRGTRHEKGRRGEPTLWGIVCEGQTAETVALLGKRERAVQERAGSIVSSVGSIVPSRDKGAEALLDYATEKIERKRSKTRALQGAVA
jgi:hypothetical protein